MNNNEKFMVLSPREEPYNTIYAQMLLPGGCSVATVANREIESLQLLLSKYRCKLIASNYDIATESDVVNRTFLYLYHPDPTRTPAPSEENVCIFFEDSGYLDNVDLKVSNSEEADRKIYTHDTIVVRFPGCIVPEEHPLIKEIFELPVYEATYTNRLFMIEKYSQGSFNLTSFKFSSSIDVDIDLNYNDNFKAIDQTIRDSIDKEHKGIVILHGEPGTGKTSYIKWLIQSAKKRVIFLPQNLVNELTSPGFISFVMNYCKNSILVIEDAESVLVSRGVISSVTETNSAISNILNISDGLLSDIFNIQIIATLNCPLEQIDPALRRKGRIIAEYEFKKLSAKKARKLSQKLGHDMPIKEATLLTDIFNYKAASPTAP